MELINLTPHPFVLVDENNNTILELPPCDNPPRASEEREQIDIINDNIPVNTLVLGDVKNLPEPEENVSYIISRIVAEACPDRIDLYIPDETVRDEEGRIIGCRALAQV